MGKFAAVIFGALIAVSAVHAQGLFRGQILPDKENLLAKAVSPEHRKLLLYTFERLARSHLSLVLNRGGTYTWAFDDGYAADRTVIEGIWRQEGEQIILNPAQGKKMILQIRGHKLTGPFLNAKGYTVEYSGA